MDKDEERFHIVNIIHANFIESFLLSIPEECVVFAEYESCYSYNFLNKSTLYIYVWKSVSFNLLSIPEEPRV